MEKTINTWLKNLQLGQLSQGKCLNLLIPDLTSISITKLKRQTGFVGGMVGFLTSSDKVQEKQTIS